MGSYTQRAASLVSRDAVYKIALYSSSPYAPQPLLIRLNTILLGFIGRKGVAGKSERAAILAALHEAHQCFLEVLHALIVAREADAPVAASAFCKSAVDLNGLLPPSPT